MIGNKNKVMVFLFLCCAGIMVIPFIASCGKSGTASPSSSATKTQMQLVNLSPDLQGVLLWVGLVKQTQYPVSYPNSSNYLTLTNIDSPVQVRSYSPLISSGSFVTINPVLKPYLKYTLFVTGLRADNTINSIFTVDTAAAPATGRGKIRFVNASPKSQAFDVSANGTMAFTNQLYLKASSFIELPAGSYEFKIMPTGTTTVISDLKGITILDGKIYTLYCRGVANGADSVAFGAGVLSNK
ncbi:MAG: DUF4397 domain-containing protein [Bacteroidota bacterium]